MHRLPHRSRLCSPPLKPSFIRRCAPARLRCWTATPRAAPWCSTAPTPTTLWPPTLSTPRWPPELTSRLASCWAGQQQAHLHMPPAWKAPACKQQPTLASAPTPAHPPAPRHTWQARRCDAMRMPQDINDSLLHLPETNAPCTLRAPALLIVSLPLCASPRSVPHPRAPALRYLIVQSGLLLPRCSILT